MISVECARCGWLYEVGRTALLAGKWRHCPFCGGPTGGECVESTDEAEDPAGPEPGSWDSAASETTPRAHTGHHVTGRASARIVAGSSPHRHTPE